MGFCVPDEFGFEIKCLIGERNGFGYAVGFGFGIGVGGLDGIWLDVGGTGICDIDELGYEMKCWFAVS